MKLPQDKFHRWFDRLPSNERWPVFIFVIVFPIVMLMILSLLWDPILALFIIIGIGFDRLDWLNRRSKS